MAGARAVPTEPSAVPLRRVRRWRAGRRLFATGLAVFLALGLLGVLGVRSAEVEAAADGYELTVAYTAVSRPGLATPWSVEVRRAGGFDEPITLATTSAYFDLFDENGLDPDPATATQDAERVYWTFEPPPGEVLAVSFDARIEPAAQSGQPATTAVLVDWQAVVSVDYRTRVMP